MATLLVDSVRDSGGNHYGIRSGNILQTRFYEYSAVFSGANESTERELPGILGNGLAGITMHGTNSETAVSTNHILCELTIQQGQDATWRQNMFRQYYRINQGGWTVHNSGAMSAHVYVSGSSGHMKSLKIMTILDPGNVSEGDTIYIKYTYQGHASGGHLYLNKNNSSNSTATLNGFSVASTMQLSEIYRPS